jgi:hypothetical protein
MTPAAKFYMEYFCIPLPWLNPLVFVLVNGIDIREKGEGGYSGLFRRLASKETGRGFGENDTNREVRVVCSLIIATEPLARKRCFLPSWSAAATAAAGVRSASL